MSNNAPTPDDDPNLSGLGRALLGTNEGSKPSGPWVPPTAEELHQILPQYEIVKMLGRGGMGAVYMGTQTALDRPVAIKILSAALEDSDAGFTERFKNEAKAMAKLNHPGIVSVYDFGQTPGGLLYIVMEYVDGTDVARMIASKGRLHTEHAMAIAAHVCDALAYAHDRGIIHRDIKPANIMVGYDGAVKVADFGLAKVNVGGNTLGLTQSGMAMGTLHYMAPEALMLGTAVDHRADIYAVGVMLFQMLSGKVPHGMFKMPSMTVPGLDPRYDGVIHKAMMEDREARYQTARELRSDLDGILTQPVVKLEPDAAQPAAALPTQARPQRPGGQQPYRPPQAQTRPAPPPPRKSSLAWLWVVIVLGALGCVGWLAMKRPAGSEQAATALPRSTTPAAPEVSPATSTPTASAPQPLLIDQDFLSAFIRGSRWKSEYGDSHYEDTLVFATTGNGVEKSPGTRYEQAAEWSVSPDGTTLSVVMKGQSDFIMRLRFQTTSLADIEFQRGRAPLLIGTIRREMPAAIAEQKPSIPSAPSVTIAHAPSAPSSPATVESASEWQPMFSGNSLAGWTGDLARHQLSDGILRSGKGDLVHLKEHGDFSLKFDMRLLPGAYVEMSIRGQNPPQPNRGAPNASFGIVLRDDATLGAGEPEPWKKHGSIYGYQSPLKTAANPVGAWNEYEITVEKQHVTVTINGVVVQDTALGTLTRKAPGGRSLDLSRTRGQLAILGFKGNAEFRNMRIKELEAGMPPATGAPAQAATQAPATPSLWIDTQGRSLQASFVRVEGSNVMLNIAGKATPVALATLSPASQQIAQQLQAALPPAGAQRVTGRWRQTNDNNTSPVFVMDVFADGTAVFAGGPLPMKGKWTLQGKSLAVDWSDLSHYDITVPDGAAPALMNGIGTSSFGKTTAMHFQKENAPALAKPGGSDTAWVPLFPNDSLIGWTGDLAAYRVAGGVLVCNGQGDLVSPKEYGNFHLKFDLRLAPETNNGIGIWRTAAVGGTINATQGFEVQVQDDTAAKFKQAQYWQRHGGIYYFREPAALPMGPVGSWNTHEIRVEGTQLEVTINGRAVQRTDLTTLRPLVPQSPVLNIARKRGHLTFLGRSGTAEFRNVQIKELP